LENETDEDLTEILDGSADEKRQLKAYMLSQAENYRDLEALVSTLDNIETANSLDSLMRE
jgi:nuclear pore complex protein Nup107